MASDEWEWGDAALDGPDLEDVASRADEFDRTRQARSKEVAEDYVELIADLIDAFGEARTVDIARRLGVTHATVNKTVSKLQRGDLVHTRPYRAIFLTERGRRLAEHARARHQIVVAFLRALGISDETARIDAEGIEHYVSAETLHAFEHATEKLQAIGESATAPVEPPADTPDKT